MKGRKERVGNVINHKDTEWRKKVDRVKGENKRRKGEEKKGERKDQMIKHPRQEKQA